MAFGKSRAVNNRAVELFESWYVWYIWTSKVAGCYHEVVKALGFLIIA